jgi:hypothetical protein
MDEFQSCIASKKIIGGLITFSKTPMNTLTQKVSFPKFKWRIIPVLKISEVLNHFDEGGAMVR